MKLHWLVLISVIFVFSFGCFPSEKPSLEPSDFLKALEEKGFRPLAVPLETYPELQVFRPGIIPAGVFELDESRFAIYPIRSAKDEMSNDRSENLEVFANENLMLVTNKKCNPKIINAFKSLRPSLTYRQAGLFVYPLGLCLVIAVFVISERAYSLRRGLTFPRKVEKALMRGEFPDKRWKKRSAAERIVFVATHEKPSPDSLKAYARLEVAALSKGLFLLEVVVAGAPLIGLLGTVTGLVRVFSAMPASAGSGGSDVFSEGIALALLTTIMGLAIAIPALIGHSYLVRVIEKRATSLDWLTARLVDAILPKASQGNQE